MEVKCFDCLMKEELRESVSGRIPVSPDAKILMASFELSLVFDMYCVDTSHVIIRFV